MHRMVMKMTMVVVVVVMRDRMGVREWRTVRIGMLQLLVLERVISMVMVVLMMSMKIDCLGLGMTLFVPIWVLCLKKRL